MAKLVSHTAQWLLENQLEQPGWVVEDFVPCGLTLIAGDPKIGKSWFSLDLALHVALGEPFWGFASTAGTVLYLCLEDTFNRVQARLQRLVDEANENLHCVVSAERIATGLIEQLHEFVDEHENTRMIIIDTFQTVRSPTGQTIYSADYEDMGVLKAFADERKVSVVVVHHTRKMSDGDVFNTISGSNGLMGCADETMVLKKKARGSSMATLSVTGRDIKDQEFSIRFNDCHWELIERITDEDLEATTVPDAIHAVIDFMSVFEGDVWAHPAQDLVTQIDCGNMQPNVLSKYLNQYSAYLLKHGIKYSKKTIKGTKIVHLERVKNVDSKPQGVDGVD